MNVKNRAAGMVFVAMLGLGGIPQSVAAEPALDEHLKVFDCETLSRVVIRQLPQAVELRLSNGNVMLPRTGGTAEERYSQGNVTFSSSGNYARITEPAGTYLCRNSPSEVVWEDARARGVDVRASGQNPEWSVEIDEAAELAFSADSGATRVVTPAPVPIVDVSSGRTTYSAVTAGHALTIVFESRLCWLQANSMASSATVTVTLDGTTTLRGCGRSFPTGRLRGTVSFDSGTALPAGAELHLRLVNTSGQSAPREVIAEQTSILEGPAPIRFEINYEPSRIYGGDAYGIQASICVNGMCRWSTRTVVPVLTRGKVGSVEIVVEPVRRKES